MRHVKALFIVLGIVAVALLAGASLPDFSIGTAVDAVRNRVGR